MWSRISEGRDNTQAAWQLKSDRRHCSIAESKSLKPSDIRPYAIFGNSTLLSLDGGVVVLAVLIKFWKT